MDEKELFVGIDLHRKQSTIAIINFAGKTIKQEKLPNVPDKILEFLKDCPSNTKVAIEATRNWYWQYDLLKEHNFDVKLGNPYLLKANSAKKKKTDKLDALMLANFLRVDLYPQANASIGYQRKLFELLRLRDTHVKNSVLLKNKIHAQLGKYNFDSPFTDLFGKDGIAWLKTIKLDSISQSLVHDCLEIIGVHKKRILDVEKQLRLETKGDQIIKVLQEVPGFGFLTATWVRAYINDIKRFPDPQHLCAYFGIVPSTYQSADNTRHGHITRCGSGKLRAVLVEASHRAKRFNATSRAIFENIESRRGKNIAYVALARKLLTLVYSKWDNLVEKQVSS